MTVFKAADILNITTRRVYQMLRKGYLFAAPDGVDDASVELRLKCVTHTSGWVRKELYKRRARKRSTEPDNQPS